MSSASTISIAAGVLSAITKSKSPRVDSSVQERLKKAVASTSQYVGGHADMSHNIISGQTGPDSHLPISVRNQLNHINPLISKRYESSIIHAGILALKDIPSKICGSLRNLMAALDRYLSIPFDILADAYNGLKALIDDLCAIINKILTTVFEWIMKAINYLLDMAFPGEQMESMLEPFKEIGDFLVDVGDLLQGHGPISAIGTQIQSIGEGFSSSKNSSQNLSDIFNSIGNILFVVASMTGASVGCANVFGAKLEKIGSYFKLASNISSFFASGSDKLEFAVDKLIPTGFGDLIENLQNVTAADILLAVLPPEIASTLKKIDQLCCGSGRVNNYGFSAVGVFGGYSNFAYERALASNAAQAPIISKNYNKRSDPILGFGGSVFDTGRRRSNINPKIQTVNGIPVLDSTSKWSNIFPRTKAGFSFANTRTNFSSNVSQGTDNLVKAYAPIGDLLFGSK